ncbi:nucleotidyltransferase [Hahella sp. CR1]|uniref:nucleotidyltransferase n=1 Tax=Hahella sp. CR1 TaxID=2992807 RepID=UPI0024433A89|nr:nucleotidyltransferase [Hahella sp. CR1]MDG9670992.1 nucleotidyltransferase [Hahella sp. CR1]
MKSKRNNRIRRLLVIEAARLMYEEGVDQYLDAKRKAAKRLVGGYTLHLPSNGEISEEIYRMARFEEPDAVTQRLFDMRVLAMDVMEQLTPFNPRLIGSVSSGRIRASSDIDLHVFVDRPETLFVYLDDMGWPYETKSICIRKEGRFMEFTHVYLDMEFPVELSVYPTQDLRIRGRSSTDGKPIDRLSVGRLRALIMHEHPEQWEALIYGGGGDEACVEALAD